MRKLKICLVSLVIAPDQQDGSAKFFTGIYNYLRRKGHDVKLITGKWNLKLNDPNIIQINFLRKSYLWIPQFFFSVFKFIKKHEFDIIHGNGPKGSLPFLFFNKKKIIATIHDLGPYETKFSIFPIEKSLIRRTIEKATYITTCSNFIKKEINFFFPKKNINNIFNLYSAIEDKFKPYPQEAQHLKKELKLNGPVILYIGRIARYKGVEDIIKAYEIAKNEISDLNLVMGGKPDFTMEHIYEEWKQKYKDIHFVGFIENEDIPIYYSMGDVFVTYSHAGEGFGLTPLEAIACGTPVICSSLLAYKEILKNNAIFVPPKQPQVLAEEIIKLLKNQDIRKRLIEKAQKFIKQYTWEAVGEKLEKVYFRFIND